MNSIDQLFSNQKEFIPQTERLKNEKPKYNFDRINSASVIIPIILFEILVCFLGAQFFHTIGYSYYSSIVLSLSIEVFYMYFSSKRNLKSLIIKTILLTISVTTLSYSAYTKDINVQNSLNLINTRIEDNKQRLIEVNIELSNLKTEKESIEKDMEIYRQHNLASKGNLILAPRRNEISIRRDNLINERNELKASIDHSGDQLINQSFIGNIKILSIQTIISILVFSILQLSICFALPDLLDGLKNKDY